MVTAYESMKSVLDSTKLYHFDNSQISFELMAYANVIDKLNSDIEDMLNECFIETACDYGLSNLEQVIGVVRDDLSIAKRRDVLQKREKINSSSFTYAKIYQALQSFSFTFDLYEFPSLYLVVVDVTGEYTQAQKAWIKTQVMKIMPAHLSVDIVFNGISWEQIDSNNYTFSYMDRCNMTWQEIDNIE